MHPDTYPSVSELVLVRSLVSSVGLFNQKYDMLLLPCPLDFLRRIENHRRHSAIKKLFGDRLRDPCSKMEKGKGGREMICMCSNLPLVVAAS